MLEYPYLLEEESYVSPCSVRDMDDLRVLDDCFPVTASESNTFAYLFYTILWELAGKVYYIVRWLLQNNFYFR